MTIFVILMDILDPYAFTGTWKHTLGTEETMLECSIINVLLPSETYLECVWNSSSGLQKYSINGSILMLNANPKTKGHFDGNVTITWNVDENGNVATWVKVGM